MIDSITNYINLEDDLFYRKGFEKGFEKGFKKGFKKSFKKVIILKMLREEVLTTKQIASCFEVSEQWVEKLRKETGHL